MKTTTRTDRSDMMTQIAERDMRMDYEEFKRETGEILRKRRVAKEQRDIEANADIPAASDERYDRKMEESRLEHNRQAEEYNRKFASK